MRRWVGVTTVVGALAVVAAGFAPVLAPTPAGAAGWFSSYWADRFAGNGLTYASPAVADLDGDGYDEVVTASRDGLVHIRNQHDDASANLPVEVVPGQLSAVDSSPGVADLDRNGSKEIVVGAGSLAVTGQQGGVVVFNADGSRRCAFRTEDQFHTWSQWPGNGPDGFSEPVIAAPAIGDVDGDNYPDIVFGSLDFRLYAIDRNCNLLSGFIRHDYDYALDRWSVNYFDDTIWSAPVLADVDNDGRYEIFQGGDSTAGALIDINGGLMRMIDWQGGRLEERWRRLTHEVFSSSPGIADINGDGRLDLVVGTGYYWRLQNPANPQTSLVWAFDALTGNDVPGWPVDLGGPYVWGGVALGDVTGDGRADVVVATADLAADYGDVRAYRGNGSLIWLRKPFAIPSGGGGILGSPIIADLDGSGVNDVAVTNGGGLFFLRGADGGDVYPPYTADTGTQNSPFVQKMGSQWYVGAAFANGVLKGIAIPTPKREPPWGQYGKRADHIRGAAKTVVPRGPEYCGPDSNPKRKVNAGAARGYWVLGAGGMVVGHGDAPAYGSMWGQPLNSPITHIVATPNGNGYWLLAADGGVFSFGNARFSGSTGNLVLNAPIIGMAATPDGNGYWLLGADGGVFTFGSARFYGSTGGVRLNAPVISMIPTADGGGYWLLGADGGVFSFGNASFHGSTGGRPLAAPVTAMASDPVGRGYWLVAADGGVFSFDVPFYGSLPGVGLCWTPVSVAMRPTKTGAGYYVLAQNGHVYAFGDAPDKGSSDVWFASDLAVRY